jgi:hydrogenase nickel incorporation protein HypB
MHMQRIRVVKDALDANNTIARANREDFDRSGVTVVNLMSAPGAGKTTLLEKTLARLDDHSEQHEHDDTVHTPRVGIIEGDVQGNFDAQRLAVFHVPVVQINTDGGFGGECHLDANMVRSALPSMPLDQIDLLVIENVGNLVCPAEFKVGEDHRVMITSVTEGDDKPLKYPLMFRACELVIVNKIDLLPHLDIDVKALLANIEAVHPGVTVMCVSARTGEGLDEWCHWLLSKATRPLATAMM